MLKFADTVKLKFYLTMRYISLLHLLKYMLESKYKYMILEQINLNMCMLFLTSQSSFPAQGTASAIYIKSVGLQFVYKFIIKMIELSYFSR